MTRQLLLTLDSDDQLRASWRAPDGSLKTIEPPASWQPVVEAWLRGRPPTHSLSPREAEVLAQLVEGQSYKQIAFDLGISIDTVRAHIKGLYRKLRVSCVAEAVSHALRRGLVH